MVSMTIQSRRKEMFMKEKKEEKKEEAEEEDKLWYRGQSGPLGRSAGRVSQLQGENGGRGRNGGRKSSILNWQGVNFWI